MKATLAYVSKVSTTVSTPEAMVDKVKQNKWSLSLASQHLNTEQLNSCALLLCSCDNADHYAVPEIAVHGSPTCNWETVVVLVRTPPPPQFRLDWTKFPVLIWGSGLVNVCGQFLFQSTFKHSSALCSCSFAKEGRPNSFTVMQVCAFVILLHGVVL